LPQQAPSCRVHQQQMVWLASHQCLQHSTTTLGSHSYSTQRFFVCGFCRWREFAFCTSPLAFGHSVGQIQQIANHSRRRKPRASQLLWPRHRRTL
jgi:hypothetical protein